MSDFFAKTKVTSIKIINVNKKEYDLTSIYDYININESLFDYFLHGKIGVTDTFDLIMNIPIVGNEEIRISVMEEDTGKVVDISVSVYKITQNEVKRGTSTFKSYDVYFCSSEKIKGNVNKLSKKFDGLPTDIIEELFSIIGSKKNFNANTLAENISFISNFWGIDNILKYICRHSVRFDMYKTLPNMAIKNKNDFMFFETLDGFKFNSLDTMLADQNFTDIIFEDNKETFTSTNNTKAYKFNNYFNILDSVKDGVFGNTTFILDNLNYGFTSNTSTLKENIENIVTVGNNNYFDELLFNEANVISSSYNTESITLFRRLCLSMLKNYNIILKLDGNISRKCGDILNLHFPNIDGESVINESFGGKYIICAIRHILTKADNKYEQNICVTKNALFFNKRLPKISKLKNI